MTWDGMATNFCRRSRNNSGATSTIEAYVQSRVVKTTLEAVFFEKRQGILDGYSEDDEARKEVGRQ
jgi:hypothetical protein